MQCCKHTVLLCVGRRQRVLRRYLLLYDTLVDKVLICRIAQGNDASSEPVRVILCLQLHLLLLVHLNGMQAILVQMGRLI